MSTEQEFEVLETMFFKYPPEWGRRIIRKSDGEVMLQITDTKGRVWTDAPMPDAKIMLPTTKTRTLTEGNPYAGLVVTPRSEAMTRAVSASEKVLSTTVREAIDSSQLLTKTTATDEKGAETETITFLGVFAATSDLTPGSVWRDSENYLRIVPD